MELNRKWRFAASSAAVALLMASCSDSNGPTDPGGPDGPLGAHVTTQPFMFAGPAVAGTDIQGTASWVVNGACWDAAYNPGTSVGTGQINPFLSIQNNGQEHGYNTDASPLPLDDTRQNFTDALPLNIVPNFTPDAGDLFGCPADEYREFILDANEANNFPNARFSIDAFDLYLCKQNTGADPATYTPAQLQAAISGGDCTKIYNITGGSLQASDAATQGSGNILDYRILVPNDLFTNVVGNECPYDGNEAAPCGWYVVLYSHMGGLGGDFVTGSTFEEFSTIRREVILTQSLTLIKHIVNDNGGTAVLADFGITTNAGALVWDAGVTVGSTTTYTSDPISVDAGSFNFSENNVAGYTEGSWSCSPVAATGTLFSAGSVSIGPGEDVTCEITNNDDAGSLQIIKHVVNDDGGTADVDDFNVTTDAGALVFGAGVTVGSTTTYTAAALSVNAGTYSLEEDDFAGYTEGSWSCTGGSNVVTTFSAGSVDVAQGETVVCEITNDDDPGSLQIIKHVVNDHGGTADVDDFNVTTNAGALVFDAGVAVGNTTTYTAAALTVDAGTYSLVEADFAGYTEGSWSCTGGSNVVTTFSAGSVDVALGETVVCEITNDDDPGSLQIIKHIVNDDGGTAVVGDFNISTDAGALNFDAGVTVGSTTSYTADAISVSAGTYTLIEIDVANYTEGAWSCTNGSNVVTAFDGGSVDVANGETVVCEITNDDQPVAEWCSPGFWANNWKNWGAVAWPQPAADFADDTYASIPDPLLPGYPKPALKGNHDPNTTTVLDVLLDGSDQTGPQTYGGPAFNYVATYLSLAAGMTVVIDPITGQPIHNCTLNQQGETIEPEA